jgi:RimJ/RimL family protein N-acetyltransferase
MNYWTTNRIRLRAIEPEDAPIFFAWNQDSEMGLMVDRIRLPTSRQVVADWVARTTAQVSEESDDFFFVVETLDEQVVGMINPHKCDRRVGDFTYGVAVQRPFQRQGYAQEAIKLVLRYYFNELPYQKVTVKVYGYNEASKRLHEAMGFLLEGQIRRAAYYNGRYYDDLIYGMTKEEFEERFAA